MAIQSITKLPSYSSDRKKVSIGLCGDSTTVRGGTAQISSSDFVNGGQSTTCELAHSVYSLLSVTGQGMYVKGLWASSGYSLQQWVDAYLSSAAQADCDIYFINLGLNDYDSTDSTKPIITIEHFASVYDRIIDTLSYRGADIWLQTIACDGEHTDGENWAKNPQKFARLKAINAYIRSKCAHDSRCNLFEWHDAIINLASANNGLATANTLDDAVHQNPSGSFVAAIYNKNKWLQKYPNKLDLSANNLAVTERNPYLYLAMKGLTTGGFTISGNVTTTTSNVSMLIVPSGSGVAGASQFPSNQAAYAYKDLGFIDEMVFSSSTMLFDANSQPTFYFGCNSIGNGYCFILRCDISQIELWATSAWNVATTQINSWQLPNIPIIGLGGKLFTPIKIYRKGSPSAAANSYIDLLVGKSSNGAIGTYACQNIDLVMGSSTTYTYCGIGTPPSNVYANSSGFFIDDVYIKTLPPQHAGGVISTWDWSFPNTFIANVNSMTKFSGVLPLEIEDAERNGTTTTLSASGPNVIGSPVSGKYRANAWQWNVTTNNNAFIVNIASLACTEPNRYIMAVSDVDLIVSDLKRVRFEVSMSRSRGTSVDYFRSGSINYFGGAGKQTLSQNTTITLASGIIKTNELDTNYSVRLGIGSVDSGNVITIWNAPRIVDVTDWFS